MWRRLELFSIQSCSLFMIRNTFLLQPLKHRHKRSAESSRQCINICLLRKKKRKKMWNKTAKVVNVHVCAWDYGISFTIANFFFSALIGMLCSTIRKDHSNWLNFSLLVSSLFRSRVNNIIVNSISGISDVVWEMHKNNLSRSSLNWLFWDDSTKVFRHSILER